MLALVSRVLPLFTLAHAQAADCQVYWPDIYTNMPMADMTLPQPDDTRDRGSSATSAVRSAAIQSPDECADDLRHRDRNGSIRRSKLHQWLEDIAAGARSQLDTARVQLSASYPHPHSVASRKTCSFNGHRAVFRSTSCRYRSLAPVATGYPAGDAAIAPATQKVRMPGLRWPSAGGVYSSNISFGAERLQGHWLDRIPAFVRTLPICGAARSGAPAARGGPRSGRTRIEYCVREGHASDAAAEHTPSGGFTPARRWRSCCAVPARGVSCFTIATSIKRNVGSRRT